MVLEATSLLFSRFLFPLSALPLPLLLAPPLPLTLPRALLEMVRAKNKSKKMRKNRRKRGKRLVVDALVEKTYTERRKMGRERNIKKSEKG
jgi:hypothetical protein